MDLDIVQTIVQGGAVGLLLAFGFLGYKVAVKLLTVGQSLLTNHLNTLTEEVHGLRKEMATLSERLLTLLDRRVEE